MSERNECAFCDPDQLKDRTLYYDNDFISFVSNPRFRDNHCLVVPRMHVEQLHELPNDILAKVMGEAALLASIVATEHGSVVVQKYQPLQAENGVKVNHVHVHAYPRIQSDTMPIPAPLTFSEFMPATQNEIDATKAFVSEKRANLL